MLFYENMKKGLGVLAFKVVILQSLNKMVP
jgi:hypothetical protein